MTVLVVKEIRQGKKQGSWWLKTENGNSLYTLDERFVEEFKKGIRKFEASVKEVKSKKGNKFFVATYVKGLEQPRAEEKKGEKAQPLPDWKKAAERLRKVEKEITSRILFSERQTRLALLTSVVGGNMMLVGDVGTGKSAVVELVASAFTSNYGYWQMSRFTSPEQVFGSVDLKAFKEKNQLIYNVESFRNKEFLIFDEFLYADGKVREILNDALVARRISPDTRGQMPIKARAIFATGNYIPNLTDPEVKLQGDVAIMDRMNIICFVTIEREAVKKVIAEAFKNSKVGERKFETPIASISDLESVKQKAKELLKNNDKLASFVAEFTQTVFEMQQNFFPKEYQASLRKLIKAGFYAASNAIVEGREVVLPRDFLLVYSSLHPKQEEAYVQALSSSMPFEVFEDAYKIVKAAHKAKEQGISAKKFIVSLVKKGEDFSQLEALITSSLKAVNSVKGNQLAESYAKYFKEAVSFDSVSKWIRRGLREAKNDESLLEEVAAKVEKISEEEIARELEEIKM